MFKNFLSIFKDMTASSVHTPTALGNEKSKSGKARDFKAILGDVTEVNATSKRGDRLIDAFNATLEKRELQPNIDGTTAKSPFPYDPNALGTLRPDQVPRFFGALTDKDKLPTKTVQLSDLRAMQDRVDPAKVKAISDAGANANGNLAVVVRLNGTEYIADGHHRLTADWLAGKATAEVHHKDLEPVDNALKRAPVDTDIANVKIVKIDEGLGLVFGWAIVCKVKGEDYYDLNIDHEGQHAGKRVPEHIPEDVMTKAALGLVENGSPGNEMHSGPDKGYYPFLFPMTTDIAKSLGIETEKTGLICAFKPPADVLAKFRDGTYTGFSIEGSRVSFEEH